MTETHVRRRLAAIIAADVAGFSRLMGVDEEGVLVRLKAYERDIIAPLVAEHSGHIFKTTGDGFLAEFMSVVDAVRCALALQEAIAARNATTDPANVLAFRIGINVGDVIVADGDFHGDGVNLAVRLQSLAELGGLCISAKVYEEVAGKVAARFNDLGTRAVKGFERPVHVYRVSSGALARRPREHRRAAVIAALALATIGALTWAGYALMRDGAPPPVAGVAMAPPSAPPPAQPPVPAAVAPRLSIAVLPFTNLSGDAAQDYLADSLTEDLTTDLSRIPGSFVISRSTAYAFRGGAVDVRQVGRELGVRYVLEGSVRARDDTLRINVQLIEVETGSHLWSDRFERSRAEWPGVEDEILGQIARVVDLELVAAETRRSLRERKFDPDANDLSMRGWALINQPQNRETTQAALEQFEAALARDPGAVEALVGLAFAHMRNVANRWSDQAAIELQKAETAIGQALARDPRHATAHMVRGIAYRAQFRYEEAVASLNTAIAYNPNLAPAFAQLGAVQAVTGEARAAIVQLEKAMRLSPRDPNLGVWLMLTGWAHLLLGETDVALDWLRRSIAANPRFGITFGMLAMAHAVQGRDDEAKAALADFNRLAPNDTLAGAAFFPRSDSTVFKAQIDRLLAASRRAGLID